MIIFPFPVVIMERIDYNRDMKCRRRRGTEESMPFINAKVTVKMSEEKKESIKKKLGEAISIIPGKSEHWLMVGFEDSYDLYFQGNKDAESAFIEVKIFGSASSQVYDKMTGVLCKIFEEELAIPASRIYIQYAAGKDWGWNGSNF